MMYTQWITAVYALIVKTQLAFHSISTQSTPVVSLWAAHLKSLLAVCMGLYVSPVCPWGPPEQETRRARVTPSSVSSHVTQTDCCINEAWSWLLKTTAGNTAKTWNLHRPHARMLDVNRFNINLWFVDKWKQTLSSILTHVLTHWCFGVFMWKIWVWIWQAKWLSCALLFLFLYIYIYIQEYTNDLKSWDLFI